MCVTRDGAGRRRPEPASGVIMVATPPPRTEHPMSRHVQVTFDAHDPRTLSSFWRDVLGYVHPGPPGVDLPRAPTRSPRGTTSSSGSGSRGPAQHAVGHRGPGGEGPGCSSSRCRRTRSPRTACTSTSAPPPGSRATSGWPRWSASANGSSCWRDPGAPRRTRSALELGLHRDGRPGGQRVLPGLTAPG